MSQATLWSFHRRFGLVPLLSRLLAGYRSVTPLPDDAELRIAFASLLIAIRALARARGKHAAHPLIAHCLPALRRDTAFLAATLH